MAGHSHWAGIKHKKEALDKKRGQLFSKLLRAISVAARNDPNPEFNPALRQAIEIAQKHNVPKDKIEKAIKQTKETENIQELIVEAYGEQGAAILIEAITDNKNRTISEIKKILSDHNSKLAEKGAVIWAFEKTEKGYQPKFSQNVDEQTKEKIEKLVEELSNHPDVLKVFVNI